jgi:hypothetical protein
MHSLQQRGNLGHGNSHLLYYIRFAQFHPIPPPGGGEPAEGRDMTLRLGIDDVKEEDNVISSLLSSSLSISTQAISSFYPPSLAPARHQGEGGLYMTGSNCFEILTSTVAALGI